MGGGGGGEGGTVERCNGLRVIHWDQDVGIPDDYFVFDCGVVDRLRELTCVRREGGGAGGGGGVVVMEP